MSESFLRIGHRGAAAYATENTLSSLQTALAYGVDMVEMDVRATKDHQLVLAHEPYLHGLDRQLVLRRHTLAQLRHLCLPGGEGVTTLEEALQFVHGQAKVNLDLKESGIEEQVVDLVEQLGLVEQVMVSSLSRRSLEQVKQRQPGIFTALSYPPPMMAHMFTSRPARWFFQRLGKKPLWPLLALLRYVLPYRMQHSHQLAGIDAFMVRAPFVSPRLVDVIHKKELKLYTWPADSPEDVAKLKQLGVDGIESNRPDVLSLT